MFWSVQSNKEGEVDFEYLKINYKGVSGSKTPSKGEWWLHSLLASLVLLSLLLLEDASDLSLHILAVESQSSWLLPHISKLRTIDKYTFVLLLYVLHKEIRERFLVSKMFSEFLYLVVSSIKYETKTKQFHNKIIPLLLYNIFLLPLVISVGVHHYF